MKKIDEEIIGMDKMAAFAVIEQAGQKARIVIEDGKHVNFLTMDYDLNRLNLEVMQSIVVSSYRG